MTKIVTISLQLYLLATSGLAQPLDLLSGDAERLDKVSDLSHGYIETLLYADPSFDQKLEPAIQNEFQALILKFEDKLGEDTLFFLQRLYSYIQRKELKHYQDQTSFYETLLSNQYDCLTSSLLIALIMDEFNLPFRVMEFDYHVAILAELEEKTIMIDAADPFTGFIQSASEVDERIAYYLSDEFNQLDEDYTALTTKPEMRLIGLNELIGLHFFNLAVAYYNDHRLIQAQSLAEKATKYYPSERHQQLLNLIKNNGRVVASY